MDAASSVPLRSSAETDDVAARRDATSSVPLRSSAETDDVAARRDETSSAADSVAVGDEVSSALIDALTGSGCPVVRDAATEATKATTDAATSVPSRNSAVAVRNIFDSAAAVLVWLRSSAEIEALDWTTDAATSVPLVTEAERDDSDETVAVRFRCLRYRASTDEIDAIDAERACDPPLRVADAPRKVLHSATPNTVLSRSSADSDADTSTGDCAALLVMSVADAASVVDAVAVAAALRSTPPVGSRRISVTE